MREVEAKRKWRPEARRTEDENMECQGVTSRCGESQRCKGPKWAKMSVLQTSEGN